jgi:mono/diheme cytochrome c family protein
MKTILQTMMLVGAGVWVVSAQAETMTESLGRFEFVNSCAACHGPDGKGEGSIAPYLNTALPDLTKLQANNEGVFPVTKVFQTIEGGPEVGPHGTRDMPAWGLRYRQRAERDPDFIEDSAAYSKLRVLALIEYLSTIQEE